MTASNQANAHLLVCARVQLVRSASGRLLAAGHSLSLTVETHGKCWQRSAGGVKVFTMTTAEIVGTATRGPVQCHGSLSASPKR